MSPAVLCVPHTSNLRIKFNNNIQIICIFYFWDTIEVDKLIQYYEQISNQPHLFINKQSNNCMTDIFLFAGSNDDMFFSKTTAISNDLDGGVAAGGISTDKPNNDNGLGLEQINGSPASSCSKWQNLILMAGFVIVLSLK